MMRHDEALLWEYAARELPSEDARLVQHHLTECPECQEKLTDVRTARGALAAAKGQAFAFTYSKVDSAIADAVERGMSRSMFGRRWVMGLSAGLVAAGLALVAWGVWSERPRETFVAPPIAVNVMPVKQSPAVERAVGLTVVGAQTRVVPGGSSLASGDVLRTDAKGEAMLKLPDATRLKLASGSQLSLTRAEADDVTLSLDRGHIAVAASHARRKGFVVHANGLMVTVVGTTFAVTSGRDGVEIGVSEGRVSVEPPTGLPQFVNAGQKVRFDSRWRSTRSQLSKAEKKELAAVAEAPVALPPPPPMPMPEPVRRPVEVAAAGGSAADMRSLASASIDELAPLPKPVEVAAPAPVTPEPVAVAAVAPVPPAPPAKPDMSGLQVPLLASPVESVRPAANPYNEWPGAKKEEAPASPNASKLGGDEIAKDQEAIFMQRGDHALANGGCEKFLLGLEDIAQDLRNPRAEKARIMRVRCFDAMMRTKETETEARRYVRDYPNGVFLDEVKSIMGGS